MSLQVSVVHGDVTEVPSSLLVLKYARGFHGADDAVAVRLMEQGVCRAEDISPEEGSFALVESRRAVAAERVLFLGTPSLFRFRYREMRVFARRAIEVAAERNLDVRALTLTVHGANYGLDIEESFRALVMGLQQGLAATPLPCLEQVVFVERSVRRHEVLSRLVEDVELVQPSPAAAVPPAARSESEPRRKYVFVAMPFSEEFEDVYQFGIYNAVRRCGYVCEKVDESVYAGSIVDRIMDGIRRADFVIADLSLERPNVYLEVGFAWGLQ
jgi:hypothetical protein